LPPKQPTVAAADRRVSRAWPTGYGLAALLLVGPQLGSLLPIGVARLAASERRQQLESTLRSDRQVGNRQRAALALGGLADSDALSALITALLADREATVRAAAADALAAIADPAASPALRAATHDESPLVRRQSSAALGRLTPAKPTGTQDVPLPDHSVVVVFGRSGSKAKSGTMANIPQRLREVVVKELRESAELDFIEDLSRAAKSRSGYSVDSSVTTLTHRTTPAGELEVSCDVSMIIAGLPGRNMVGMVSASASVIGPRGPSTRPTPAFLESLESEALTQAVKETHTSMMSFIRRQARAGSPSSQP
jgi:hypothetical protein